MQFRWTGMGLLCKILPFFFSLSLSLALLYSRFMVIWLTFLPLAFVSTCGWATVPMMFVLSYLILGVEQIGVTIEEPFTILALDKICGRIQAVLLWQLEAYETVQRSLATELQGTQFATKPM